MLRFLSIRDFVIVDSLDLDFQSGFTALTGETGAGKSILIDALSLALGERSEAALVRNGAARAEIAAEFDTTAVPGLQAWLQEQGLEGDEGVCLLRRVLDAGGRSRAFINGAAVTQQQLREAGAFLLDIHGQHAHQALLRADAQRTLLDGYAGLGAQAENVAALYRAWQALRRRRIELSKNAQALADERELLLFQRNELEALAFLPEEWGDLQSRHACLSHASSLLETAQFGVEVLSESETACLSQLGELLSRVREGVGYDPALREALGLLESAQNELQEAVYSLRHYQQRLDADPQALQEVEERIADIVAAARKYRGAPEDLPDVLQRIAGRLAEIGDGRDEGALEREEQEAHRQYHQAAQQLSLGRADAAGRLAMEITSAMQKLAMQGGRFEVALQPLSEGQVGGLENIEFQVSANPGMPLRNLAKVASGGELSRISLAIQVALSEVASVPTLIFDEVDTGIGGRVAEIVGQLLKKLGGRRQVLCVTHLPQVAAMADHQWQVSKSVHEGMTVSGIRPLSEAERVEEIARMLGGVQITETTRRHAAEMLGIAV